LHPIFVLWGLWLHFGLAPAFLVPLLMWLTGAPLSLLVATVLLIWLGPILLSWILMMSVAAAVRCVNVLRRWTITQADVRSTEEQAHPLEVKLSEHRVAAALSEVNVRSLIQRLSFRDVPDPEHALGIVRTAVAEDLRNIGVLPLIEALKDVEADVRAGAAVGLGIVGDALAALPLSEVLKDRDRDVRRNAAEALGEVRDAHAVLPLVEALTDEHWSVRSAAARAVGNIGDDGAVTALREALKDSDSDVRRNAAEALNKLGDAHSLLVLKDEQGGMESPEKALPGVKVEYGYRKTKTPSGKPRLDDLGVPAAKILRSLPDVERVDVYSPAHSARARIIHLRQTHTLDRNVLERLVEARWKRKLTPKDLSDAYTGHIAVVNRAQQAETRIAETLTKEYGIDVVYLEGLTNEYSDALEDRVDEVRQEMFKVPELERAYRRAKAAGDQAGCREYQNQLQAFNQHRAEVGTAGKLLGMGLLDEVLPAENLNALLAAMPEIVDGRLTFNKGAYDAREDVVVKNLLKKGNFAFVIFGAAHDLTDAIKRVRKDCEYVRITPKGFVERPEDMPRFKQAEEKTKKPPGK
jgi:HEAT repeats